MNILQRIFTDYYEEIKYTLHPRKTEMENIDKMINCGVPSFGGAMYGCSHCGKLKFVPFRCHSRFWPNIVFIAASINGELLFFLLSVMTLWNVRTVNTRWCFLNFITITSAYPSKNFTRKQCPNLVESVLLHKFLRFYDIILWKEDELL